MTNFDINTADRAMELIKQTHSDGKRLKDIKKKLKELESELVVRMLGIKSTCDYANKEIYLLSLYDKVQIHRLAVKLWKRIEE